MKSNAVIKFQKIFIKFLQKFLHTTVQSKQRLQLKCFYHNRENRGSNINVSIITERTEAPT